MTFKVRFWTGPTLVEALARRTQLSAGTEHVYGRLDADNADAARATVLTRLAGVSGFKSSDVQVMEVSL